MAKKKVTQQIQVRNLETDVVRTVGPNFLASQAKPYQGQSKLYENGVWVQDGLTKKVKSPEAEEIVRKAATPATTPHKPA